MNSFYNKIDQLGGLYKLDEQSNIFYKYIDSLNNQIVEKVNNTDYLFPLGKVEIKIIQNNNFNAFAHYDNGVENIAVFSGLINFLDDISNLLYSNQNPSKETLNLVQITLKNLKWNYPLNIFPKEKENIILAQQTKLIAYYFILKHEIGHIVHSHIPFIQIEKKVNLNFLFEIENESEITLGNLAQKLELDADRFAIRAVLDNALTTWNLGKIFPININYEKFTKEQYLRMILNAVIMVFFCMDIPSKSDKLISTSNHPVPLVRMLNCLMCILEITDDPFDVPRELIYSSFAESYSEVSNIWNSFEISAQTLKIDFEEAVAILDNINTKNNAQNLNQHINNRLTRFDKNLKDFDKYKSFYKNNKQ